MSEQRMFTWRRHVQSARLPATTKLVLLTLATHMSAAGDDCFPSVRLIAYEASLSRRAVMTHLQSAEEAGWIERRALGHRGQRWRHHAYHPRVPEGVRLVTFAEHVAAETGTSELPGMPLEGGHPDDTSWLPSRPKAVTEGDLSSSDSSPSSAPEDSLSRAEPPVDEGPVETAPDPAPPAPPADMTPATVEAYREMRETIGKPLGPKAEAVTLATIAELAETLGFSAERVLALHVGERWTTAPPGWVRRKLADAPPDAAEPIVVSIDEAKQRRAPPAAPPPDDYGARQREIAKAALRRMRGGTVAPPPVDPSVIEHEPLCAGAGR